MTDQTRTDVLRTDDRRADVRWTVQAVEVPPSLDHPAAWAVIGSAEAVIASEVARWGHADLAVTAHEMLAKLQTQQYATKVRLVAVAPPVDPGARRQPRDVAGTALLSMPRQSNEHLAFIDVTVHPDHRGSGAGSLLLADAERLAAQHGRTTVIGESEHVGEPADGPDVLQPPTGSGRIAATDAGAAFAVARGFALEQAERYSVLQLPVPDDDLARLHREAGAVAGDAYRLIAWADRTPDEWAEQYAALFTRMSTDAPMADLEIEEDRWDVERLRVAERSRLESGSSYLTVVAEHVPTATLAAFTMVALPLDKPWVVYQEDTLVLREHRGRRLGMLVKTDLLRRLHTVRPDAERVHTWNAEENDHMLAINVALGFRPTGVAGAWQKRLSPQD